MKKLVSAAAAAVILSCIAPTTVSYAADVTACEFKVTADKTSVHPGEEVTFTVTITPNGDMYGYDVFLNYPAGLTYVKSEQDSGLVAQLGWNADFVDAPTGAETAFVGVTFGEAYTSKAPLVLGTVTCKADSDIAEGNLIIGFTNASDVVNSKGEVYSNTAVAATVKIPGLKKVAAVAAACNKEGNSEYYKCDCGDAACTRIYATNDRTTPTTLDSVKTAKTPHDFTAETVDPKHLKSAATCKTPAVYFKSCVTCHENGTDTFENGAPDPTKHGNNTEIKNAVEATCTTPGNTGDTYCKDCGAKIKNGDPIPAAHKGGKATCIEKAKCEVCGEEYGDLDPENHGETVIKNAVEATAESDGYTGDKVCKDCEKVLEKGTVIPKTGSSSNDTSSDSSSSSGSSSGNSSSGNTSSSSTTSSDTPSGNTPSSDTNPSNTDSSSVTNPGYIESVDSSSSSNDNTDNNNNNPATGIEIAVIPVLLAAGAAVIIFNNKKR